MTTDTQTPVDHLLDRLALFEATEFPVLSVYLDARPNEVGRDGFAPFLKKELHRRVESYALRSPERESIEADAERIQAFVASEVDPSANTLVLFACSAAGVFETLSLPAALGESRVFVGPQPHLYPLARLLSQYRRYAALVADTNIARLFVFGLGGELREEEVQSPKARRTRVGGWSQMRYQRRVDQQHVQHAKEAVEVLTRVMREEAIDSVFLAGDAVIVPLLREQLPKEIAERVVDTLWLDVRAPEHEILKATLESLQRHDAATEVEAVAQLIDEYRGGGLAVVGPTDTLAALEVGQVDELFLAAAPIGLDRTAESQDDESTVALPPEELARREALAEDLVARARRTSASTRFIQDVSLLWGLGGVGARLRYRLTEDGPAVPAVEVARPEPAS
jgi:peptide chain release factor subunit 1